MASDANLPRPVERLANRRGYERPALPRCVDLRLDGNEGTAVDPTLLEVLRSADPELLRRYPDGTALQRRAAAHFDVAPERVLVLAGGDEVLDRVFRAFTGAGRNAVWHEPSFEMLPHYARLSGCEVRPREWLGGPFPVDALCAAIDADTGVVVVVSPNNPTGAVATFDDVRRIAEAAPHAVVVLDHAYVEFAAEDLTARALALPNVVVLRTLSKAHALAGLRIGFALGSPAVIATLRAAGSPFSVAAPSLLLGAAALRRDVTPFVSRVRATRAALTRALQDLGLDVLPSEGNFVLARGPAARWLHDALRGLGIAVRAFPGRPLLEDAVRITCPDGDRDRERLLAGCRAALAPEALLFDLDGVLADVSRSYRRAILATGATFGVTLTEDDVRAAKAAGHANDDWELTWRLVRERGVDVALEEVTERFEALYQGSEERPGLRATERPLIELATFERFAARLPLAVVTGRPRRDAERFLAEHGLDRAVEALVCMADCAAKPDPAPVRLALARLGVERAWLVGDTRDDLDAARAAGVVPIGVPAPGDDPERAAAHLLECGASRVLPALRDLEEMLP